ncbi:MAG: CDP-alcohol phosphatidyltransferase family protein [Fibrobacter sp.]|nr:CDP-alcohol phosphatidyltransferase family protein [Fibrobacter sp.]
MSGNGIEAGCVKELLDSEGQPYLPGNFNKVREMLEGLKPLYNATLKPAALAFNKVGIHPNHITVAGVFLFIGAGYYAAIDKWIVALWLVIAGGLFDGLDGVLARESGKKSVFGAILDSCCDRLTEIAVIAGVLFYYLSHDIHSYWGVILCFTAVSGSLMVSYVKARCEGMDVPCKSGILQRPERIILLCAGLCFGPEIMFWILIGISVLSFFTSFQRLVEASSYCKSNKKTV